MGGSMGGGEGDRLLKCFQGFSIVACLQGINAAIDPVLSFIVGCLGNLIGEACEFRRRGVIEAVRCRKSSV